MGLTGRKCGAGEKKVKVRGLGKAIMLTAVTKAAIAGAGVALATLASIDFAIAVIAKETWDSWQVESLINQFALAGGVLGAAWHIVKAIILR